MFFETHRTFDGEVYAVYRPGNGSPSATNVLLLQVVVLGAVVVSSLLRLFYFTTDRRSTLHTHW